MATTVQTSIPTTPLNNNKDSKELKSNDESGLLLGAFNKYLDKVKAGLVEAIKELTITGTTKQLDGTADKLIKWLRTINALQAIPKFDNDIKRILEQFIIHNHDVFNKLTPQINKTGKNLETIARTAIRDAAVPMEDMGKTLGDTAVSTGSEALKTIPGIGALIAIATLFNKGMGMVEKVSDTIEKGTYIANDTVNALYPEVKQMSNTANELRGLVNTVTKQFELLHNFKGTAEIELKKIVLKEIMCPKGDTKMICSLKPDELDNKLGEIAKIINDKFDANKLSLRLKELKLNVGDIELINKMNIMSEMEKNLKDKLEDLDPNTKFKSIPDKIKDVDNNTSVSIQSGGNKYTRKKNRHKKLNKTKKKYLI